MVHKKYKSILFLGMLLFCSISANEFPDVLYIAKNKKVSVKYFDFYEIKRNDLSFSRLNKVYKVRLKYDNSHTRRGYIFQNKVSDDQNYMELYRRFSNGASIAKKNNIFYFQELEREEVSQSGDNDAGTDYENDSDMDTSDDEF